MNARVPPEEVAVRILSVGAALVVVGMIFRLMLELLVASIDVDSNSYFVLVVLTLAVSLVTGYAYRRGVSFASNVGEEVTSVRRLVDKRDNLRGAFFVNLSIAIGSLFIYFTTLRAGFYTSPEVLVTGSGASLSERLAAVLTAFIQTGCGMLVIGGLWIDWELLKFHRGSSSFSLGPGTLKSRGQERPVMSEEDSAGGTDAPDTAADEDELWARETAPQSPYTAREVGVGLLVFAVCTLLAFGLPLALA